MRTCERALHDVLKRETRLNAAVKELREELKAATDEGDRTIIENELAAQVKQRDMAAGRAKKLKARIKRNRKNLDKVNGEIKRAVTKKRYWKKRTRFLIVKLIKWRKWRKARQNRLNPKFESWMANGCDWQNCNEATRRAAARMVVTYGLTITSMNRTYVPPGGSTTSYHLSGKAVDAAGAWETMIDAQVAEYKRFDGDTSKLELFGPDNNHNLKNGQPMTLPEGDPLETLHDTHVHSAQ